MRPPRSVVLIVVGAGIVVVAALVALMAADRGGLLRTQAELEDFSTTDGTAPSSTTVSDSTSSTSAPTEETVYNYYAAKNAGPCSCPAGGCPQTVGALTSPWRNGFQSQLASALREIAGKNAYAAITADPPPLSWEANSYARRPYPGLFNVPPGYCFGIAFFQKAWLGGLISIIPHNPETVTPLTELEFIERVHTPVSQYLSRDALAPRPIDVRNSNVWQLINVLHEAQTGSRASTSRDQSLLGTNSTAQIQEKLTVLLDPHGAEMFAMAAARSPGPEGERPPVGHAIVVYRGRDGGTYAVDGDAVSPLQTQRGADRNYLCWDSFEVVPTSPTNPRLTRRTVETCTLELYTVRTPRE